MFKAKSALITGGSRGLGQSLGLALAAQGARVVLVARRRGPLDDVVAQIRAAGGEAYGIAADIADKQSTYVLAGQAAQLVGPIDVLVQNASSLGPTPLRQLLDTECEDLEQVLQTNLVGPFRLAKAVVGSMVLRGAGTVVHISSDAAMVPYPGWGAYGVSKLGFDHLARIWAAELADTGVRFLSIDPGEMDTAMHAAAMPDADPRQLASPAKVAAAIAKLIGRSHELQSGTRIAVDTVKEALS
jgi:NAD(P)-dependent dehydrogenase (short-subunit alcohol dehydrogenase family)